MKLDLKTKPSSDGVVVRSLKPIYKWISWAMVAVLVYAAWQNGLVANLFQDENYRAYIEDSTQNTPGWEKIVTLQVVTQPYDAFGATWDGLTLGGVLGPFFSAVELTSPADLVPCVIAEGAPEAQCALRRDGDRIKSYCQNSNECDWRLPVPADRPYAIVVFDADSGWSEGIWELVDVLIVSRDGDPSLVTLDRAARILMEAVSPTTVTMPGAEGRATFTYSRGEADRRERPTVVLDEQQASQGINLTQSYIALFP